MSKVFATVYHGDIVKKTGIFELNKSNGQLLFHYDEKNIYNIFYDKEKKVYKILYNFCDLFEYYEDTIVFEENYI